MVVVADDAHDSRLLYDVNGLKIKCSFTCNNIELKFKWIWWVGERATQRNGMDQMRIENGGERWRANLQCQLILLTKSKQIQCKHKTNRKKKKWEKMAKWKRTATPPTKKRQSIIEYDWEAVLNSYWTITEQWMIDYSLNECCVLYKLKKKKNSSIAWRAEKGGTFISWMEFNSDFQLMTEAW